MNFQEAGGPHRSPKQIENRYLPPHRREKGSSKNSIGERSNPIRTTTPQRVYANTNSITQPGVYNEPLPLARGTGGTISPLLGVGINRWQQIPQPFMQSLPPPPNFEGRGTRAIRGLALDKLATHNSISSI